MIKEKNKSIYISEFTYEGTLYHLKKPVKITVQKKEDLFILFNKKVSILAYDEDFKEAYEIFKELFSLQYRLTQKEDRDLTKSAKKLKKHLLSIVEKVE